MIPTQMIMEAWELPGEEDCLERWGKVGFRNLCIPHDMVLEECIEVEVAAIATWGWKQEKFQFMWEVQEELETQGRLACGAQPTTEGRIYLRGAGRGSLLRAYPFYVSFTSG